MVDIGAPEAEKNTVRETRRGPYIRAVFNPGVDQFRGLLQNSSFSILEIGCGKDPRLSWKLDAGDLWVGCDPSTTSESVHKGAYSVNTRANLVIIPSIAADIPKFTPGVISVIAPNQEDIVEGKVFNDELTVFLDPKKNQSFVVVLDTRTFEAERYQAEAKRKIYRWMRENNFEPDPESPILDKVKPNSADLGERNIRMCFTRNS